MITELVPAPPFVIDLSPAARNLMGELNAAFADVLAREAAIEREKAALQITAVTDLSAERFDTARKANDRLMALRAEKVALMRRCDSEWPQVYKAEYLSAKNELTRIHDTAYQIVHDKLIETGWIPYKQDGQFLAGPFRSIPQHPDVMSARINLDNSGSWPQRARTYENEITRLEAEIRRHAGLAVAAA
jgi:hypothetical protein